MRKALRMTGATLTAATLLALAAPAIATAGQIRPGTGTGSGPFVALGDSYAAGNLIPDSPAGTPAGCLRSSHDYGADAAAALGMTGFVDATCNGATTASMTQSQSVPLGTNPPQLDALAADDSVVTLTIGGYQAQLLYAGPAPGFAGARGAGRAGAPGVPRPGERKLAHRVRGGRA